MCTLTIVPAPENRVRLAFNRDEQRTRAAGLPPRVKPFGGRNAVLPTDPASGGTWLAVSDAGLAFAVLNVNTREEPNPPAPFPGKEGGADHPPSFPGKGAGGLGRATRSRGELIPALIGADSPSAALAIAERDLRYPEYAPFRLVLVGQGVVADVRWDGREPMVMSRLLGGSPQMFTSSGLGDHLVEGVRRELFDDLFAGPPETWEAAQDTFHRHRWPGREHLSVNMSRADARTVSHAVIEIGRTDAVFTYHPDSPDVSAETVTVSLPLLAGVA